MYKSVTYLSLWQMIVWLVENSASCYKILHPAKRDLAFLHSSKIDKINNSTSWYILYKIKITPCPRNSGRNLEGKLSLAKLKQPFFNAQSFTNTVQTIIIYFYVNAAMFLMYKTFAALIRSDFYFAKDSPWFAIFQLILLEPLNITLLTLVICNF